MNANSLQFMNGPQFAYYYNMADMRGRLANGSIADMKQYPPVFTKANYEAMLNGDLTDGWDNVNYIDKVFGTGINQKTQHHRNRVVVTKCVISHLSAIWDRMVILITLLYKRYNLRTNIETELAGRPSS
ncbi:hypothetical protein NXX42_00200 [Bacteroides thetaiotaomicron]|nr:hypothetical protein [Bacteroides thetaiotaomicron]